MDRQAKGIAMPGKPRMYLPGVPCHVTQRGNNREACFFAPADHILYLSCLAEACTRYRVAVHAYVLMTNHVHLLMTPMDRDERRDAYRALLASHLDEGDIHTIRTAARFSMPVGDDKFKAQIEHALGRDIGHAKRGRSILGRRCDDNGEKADK